jgi:ANTAR domain
LQELEPIRSVFSPQFDKVSHKLTREQAFDLLRIASQNSNLKIRDVAEEVGDTGTLPCPLSPR